MESLQGKLGSDRHTEIRRGWRRLVFYIELVRANDDDDDNEEI